MLSRAASHDLGTAALLPFFGLTFAIMLSLFALFLIAPAAVERLLGPPSGSHPHFILAVHAPAISAFRLVLLRAGPGGMVRFLSRLTLWRAPTVCYLVLPAGIPAVFYAGALIKGAWLLPPFDSPAAFLGLLSFMAVLGPVDEFGWRGGALPLLRRRMVPFAGALVVELFAVSVIMMQLSNASRGSLLPPMLFRWQLNNPALPDGQPGTPVSSFPWPSASPGSVASGCSAATAR